jgi:hypothetical protein
VSKQSTKKVHPEDPDLLVEYDFRGGERGKYAKRYAAGSNVVVLDPDVAELFTDSESVNRTLRAVGQIMHDMGETPNTKKRSARR